MITTFYEHTPSNLTNPKGLAIQFDENNNKLFVYRDGELLGEVELTHYTLFRPDRDAMFISKKGRVWKPDAPATAKS